MTLILTYASRGYVLQITDRLLTARKGLNSTPFDVLSNKNVVLCARNGIIILGYTGFAYLDGTPADQWIVERLTGLSFASGERPPALSCGSIKLADIGQSLMLLKRKLEEAPVQGKLLSQWKESSFDICVAGWQWKGKFARPILAWLSKPAHSLNVELGYMPRFWHWERNFTLGIAPACNLSPSQREKTIAKLRGCGPDQAESVMVETIREAAKSVAEVGPHCMSILLSPPGAGTARIRYVPLDVPATTTLSTSEGGLFTVPVAFTPWLVGPHQICAPSINSGGMQVPLGHYLAVLEAPRLRRGLLALFSSQRRPNAP